MLLNTNLLFGSFFTQLVFATGAWIITGGTNTGVMAFVGEAVRDHMLTTGASEQNVVALGIATWGIVDNKDNLEAEDVSVIGCFIFMLNETQDHCHDS